MQYEAWVFSATPEDTTGDVANENPEDCADSAGEHNHLHIYLSVFCLFVFNKCQKGSTDRAQILCGT